MLECDWCGQPSDDVQTYTVRVDGGQAWEIDLDAKHAEPILKLAKKGRVIDNSARRGNSMRTLEGRIRGLPREA